MQTEKKRDPYLLAIEGGEPVRKKLLPYGKQTLDEQDISEVVATLQSDWLTTGPKVNEFEKAFAETVESTHAVSFSNGTAALHAMMNAIGIKEGDEVILPSLTFVASANAVLYEKGTPVFCDVDPKTLLMDPLRVEAQITKRTKAVLAVDYAGQTPDYEKLEALCEKQGIWLLTDACHSLGAKFKKQPVGKFSDLTAFSFHPVKQITSGEGGMVTTTDAELARKLRQFRNHGIDLDFRQRELKGVWHYDMQTLGNNYRLTDFQCALGLSQLRKLDRFVDKRKKLAQAYDAALKKMDGFKPLEKQSGAEHAYHLYVVRLDLKNCRVTRDTVLSALRAEGIGVNLHYRPVHLHSYYQKNFKFKEGSLSHTEKAYSEILTLPLFPLMTENDQKDVLFALEKVWSFFKKN